MSIITPITVEGFPRYARPWNNITPFTYRDGLSYLEVLEGMRVWLKDSLVPHVDAEMAEIGKAWNDEVLALIAGVESALASQAQTINAGLEDQNATVDAALDAQNLSIAGIIAQGQTDLNAIVTAANTAMSNAVADINARADQWLTAQITNNDQITTEILNDANSGARGALGTIIASAVYSVNPGEALQPKIDALAAAGGGELWLKPGTFILPSNGIVIPNKVSIRGSGEYATTIDATQLAPGAIGIHMPSGSGQRLSDMVIQGSATRNATGVALGRLLLADPGELTDFVFTNVRINSFNVGLQGIYAWCGAFINTRIHGCIIGAKMGSQMNAITFNGSVTSYSNHGVELSNAEGITFQNVNFDSNVATGYAIKIFQSHALLNLPYVENVSKFIYIGATSEAVASKSTLIVNGGRVCGQLYIAGSGNKISIISPWLISNGTGTPFSITAETLGTQPRQIRVDANSDAFGLSTVVKWDSSSNTWPFANGYGGTGVTATKTGDFHKATSPVESQGIQIGATEIGAQYVLSYRARKADGNLALRDGANATSNIKKVDSSALDFETIHVPFIAKDTMLRMLWLGDLDLQWVSLTKGLNFISRGQ